MNMFVIVALALGVGIAVFLSASYGWRSRHVVPGVGVAVFSMTVLHTPVWTAIGLGVVASIGSWTVEQKKTIRVIGIAAAVAVAFGVPALVAPSPENSATAATQYVKIGQVPDSGSREQVEDDEVILESASSEEPVSGFAVLGENLEYNTVECRYEINDPNDYTDDTMIAVTTWIIMEEDCLPNLTPEKRADYLAHLEESFGFAEGTGEQEIRELADWQRANPTTNLLAVGVFNQDINEEQAHADVAEIPGVIGNEPVLFFYNVGIVNTRQPAYGKIEDFFDPRPQTRILLTLPIGWGTDDIKPAPDLERAKDGEFVLGECANPGKDIVPIKQVERVAPPKQKPTPEPTPTPTEEPTEKPTPTPTEKPTEEPTEKPTPTPTEKPTEEPTEEPTPTPTEEPTEKPEVCEWDSELPPDHPECLEPKSDDPDEWGTDPDEPIVEDSDPVEGEETLPIEDNPVDPVTPVEAGEPSTDVTVPGTETPGNPENNEQAPEVEAPAPTEEEQGAEISEPEGDVTVTTESETESSEATTSEDEETPVVETPVGGEEVLPPADQAGAGLLPLIMVGLAILGNRRKSDVITA